MPAPPLTWKEDEGTDVHLLRDGPESKRLIDTLDLDPGQAASVAFIPNLLGSVGDHGVEVTADIGVVKAKPHPNPNPDPNADPPFPKVRNFLLAAVFDDGAGHTSQTEIRVHLHDSVEEIWLTPSTLSIHQGADECRFTVLARFDDNVDGPVGDITDWPGLSFQSDDQNVVKVLGDGRLQAAAPGGRARVTATLTLPSPSTHKTSGPATVEAMPGWAQVAAAARIDFVAGRVIPNRGDPAGAKPDSVKSVVEGARNILFIADGFQHDQRFDYRNIVNTIARVVRGEEAAFAPTFQPLKLLKDSINFWTVFLPSRQNGITALGEYFLDTGPRPRGVAFPPQPRPADDAKEWNYPQVIHEVGMPIQADGARSLSKLVAEWQQQFGPHVTEERVKKTFQLGWKAIVSHAPLNERDTAFGMTHALRPRAALTFGDLVNVQLSSRRTNRDSLEEFIGNLSIGGFPIGARWMEGGADAGLVCMVCLSDHDGGLEGGDDRMFAVTTGTAMQNPINLEKASGPGFDLKTGPVRTTWRHLLASTVAHEFGHAMGLGDEYGDGAGTSLPDGSDTNPVEPNLQAKVVIAPSPQGPGPAFDPTKIKWLWPRIASIGVLAAPLDASNVSAADVHVPLRDGHSRRFAKDDIVRFRQSPDLLPATMDLFVDLFFRVTTVENDAVRIVPVRVTAGSNATTDIPMGGFDSHSLLIRFQATETYCLIRPRRVAGKEHKLVAEPILQQIQTSRGPLNAPKGSIGALCVAAAGGSGSTMTPTNLPDLARVPRTKADIVGIYEGGGYHDCGVFRSAGRCRMRDSDVITKPFCHVCRFILVETLDPTRHGQLDRLYPEVGS
jgi:hypothetical protein